MDGQERKPGRTLLVKNFGKDFDLSTLKGVEKIDESPTSAKFIEFKDVEDAIVAFQKLRTTGVRVKYAYYKLFVKFKTDVSDLFEDEVQGMVEEVLDQDIGFQTNAMNFKLYKKKGQFINCGEVVVDLLRSVKHFSKRSFSGAVAGRPVVFEIYRYRTNKPQNKE